VFKAALNLIEVFFMKGKQKKQIINYYEVLGIPSNATLEQINKAFRLLSVKCHPDKLTITDPKEKEKAETRYKTIVEAHNVLKEMDKKANYDRLLTRSQQNTTTTQISGLLATHLLPLSADYKELHSKIVTQTIIEPKRKQASVDFVPVIAEGETGDFFVELKRRPESKESSESLPFKDALTPSYAFSLFEDFLKGKYCGEDYVHLKNYFEGALQALDHSEHNKLTVELYEGFLSLIQIVEQDDKRKDIHASINKILRYACYKEPTKKIKPVEKLAELFQNSVFRALYSAGMQQQWQTPFEVDINLFVESQLDEALEADTDGQKDGYWHTLYIAQEDVYQKYQTLRQEAGGTLGASEWRTLAFYCLDYHPVISGNKQVTINQLLQVCFFLKEAAKFEQDPRLQFADEKLIIQTCLSIIRIGEHDKLYIDSYAHHYSLCLLSTLNREHSEALIIIKHLKTRMLKLMGFFPNHEALQSNLNLIHNASTQINYVREYLHTLVGWLSEKKKGLAFKKTTILNSAYEASLNGTLPFDKNMEKKLRRKLMKAFLEEKGASFLDISKNLHSDWVMVNMDQQGWLQPDLVLPFAASLKTYQSLDGVEIDLAKGTVRFALKPWTPQDPLHKKAFTDCDWMQIVKLGGYPKIYFSLDPLSTEHRHHPFQQMVYAPVSLRDTEFFSTLFYTDYLLKFFTTGYEVQGQYPYEVRSVQSLIGKLPRPLQESILQFQNQKKSGKVHRFWIEASTLPAFKEENDRMVRWSFGNIRMIIKKHGMEFDASGQLIDSPEEDEGWRIYVLNKIEDFEQEIVGKDFNFKALVFIKNTDQVYYFDEQTKSRRPFQVVLPPELKRELLVQAFDKNGLLLIGKEKALYDNNHFAYQLTTHVCRQINKPTHFSSERVLAEELTEHYDALAQCFPEFERLKQLSVVVGAAKEVAGYYYGNEELLKKSQDKYNDQSFWNTEKAELCQKIYKEKQTEFSELHKKIQTGYSNHISEETAKLQKIRTDMGSFTFTASSPEVRQACNNFYNEIEKDIKAKHGEKVWQQHSGSVWSQHITPEIPKIVQQFNEVGVKKKTNYRQQIVNLFPEISQFLGALEFNRQVDQFMENNVSPLARAIADHSKKNTVQSLKTQLTSAFSGVTEAQVTDALNGKGDALAQAVSQHIVNRIITDAKTALQAGINTKLKLQAQFKALGLGVAEELADTPALTWVPASSHHEVDSEHSTLVYGGVLVQPSLACKLEANRHSMKLQMPSVSAFARVSDIRDAEVFVRDLKSLASRFGPQTYITSVDHMARDLEQQINTARFESIMQRPALVSAPLPALPNLPLFEVLNEGIVGKAKYKIFGSDSTQCAVNKSEINELYRQVHNGDNPLEVPRLARYIARLESLTQSCKPAVPEDERKVAFEDKNFLHMSARGLSTYILNQFEKFKGGGGPKVSYPHVFYKMQAAKDRETQAKLAEKQVEAARQAEEHRQLQAKREAKKQAESARKTELNRQLDQNPIAAAASLLSHGLKIMDPIVSHVTDAASVKSIMVDGVQLKSYAMNYLGGEAFYVAEAGYAPGQKADTHLILFSRPRDMKIHQETQADVKLPINERKKAFPNQLRTQGIDAIQYEGDFLKPNGRYSHNLAIINNPHNLKPLGVYPVATDEFGWNARSGWNSTSSISTTPTRILQALGIAGTGVAIVFSAKQVLDSDTPFVKAAHVAAEFWAGFKGGAAAGSAAVMPCSDLGLFAPQASIVIVPVCIAGASIVGGVAAGMGLNLTLEALSGHLKATSLLHERNVKYVEALEQDRANTSDASPDLQTSTIPLTP
jgi:curved DNA-binding protein CbpA